MSKKKEPRKAPTKNDKKKSEPVLNDIIQKIVDSHATVDQALSEMSNSCKPPKDCEGN